MAARKIANISGGKASQVLSVADAKALGIGGGKPLATVTLKGEKGSGEETVTFYPPIAKGAPVTAYVDQGTPLDRAKFSKATVTESNAAPATPAAAPATPPAPTPAPPVSQPRTS